MQILIQSYQRLNYLKQTVESLKCEGAEIFIVDGGSDRETKKYICSNADKYLFFDGNPGADFLKNEGIKLLIADDYFIMSADDIVYPSDYLPQLESRFETLNKAKLEWAFCSCNMLHVESQNLKWEKVNGVEVYEISGPQSASAIVSRKAMIDVGLFPQFGKFGAGDWAIGKKLIAKKYRCCYLRQPMVEHLGNNNLIDYPEFQARYDIDINENYKKAIK